MKKTIRKRIKKNYSYKNKIVGGSFPLPEELKNDPSKGSILVYFALGIGCDTLNREDINNLKHYIAEQIDTGYANVNIICHKFSSGIKTILKSRFSYCPLVNSKFVLSFTNSIIENVDKYEKIFVFGHSFGGAIVNRVAEELHKNISLSEGNKSKIIMATFGSIYLPKDLGLVSQSSINIINYLAVGDVASICNRIKTTADMVNPDSEETRFLIPLDKRIPTMAFKQEKKIIFCCFYEDGLPNCSDIKKGWVFGSKDEWQVHMNYDELHNYLLSYKTNDINAVVESIKLANPLYSLMFRRTPLRRTLTPVIDKPVSEVMKPG